MLFVGLSHAQEPLLQITAPVDRALVTSGQTISISVSADPSVQVVGVVADGPFPDLQSGSSSNQFLQTIPASVTPGFYHLTAIGLTSTDSVDSDPVTIDVEPQFTPIAIDGGWPTFLLFS
jgi:hypothetical protein